MRTTSLSLLFSLSACGIVNLDVPDVARTYALTAESRIGGGCGIDGVLFKTQVSVEEMRQRMYGFRACVKDVESAQISADISAYSAGPSCATPGGSISSMQVHIGYSSQGLAQVQTVACGSEAVDLSNEDAVLFAVNLCLSRVAEASDSLVAALNAASGVLNVSLSGECSSDACFKADANLAVELNGIQATNCL